jgi:hypothetical protein
LFRFATEPVGKNRARKTIERHTGHFRSHVNLGTRSARVKRTPAHHDRIYCLQYGRREATEGAIRRCGE